MMDCWDWRVKYYYIFLFSSKPSIALIREKQFNHVHT
jgi:hypothetical protein